VTARQGLSLARRVVTLFGVSSARPKTKLEAFTERYAHILADGWRAPDELELRRALDELRQIVNESPNEQRAAAFSARGVLLGRVGRHTEAVDAFKNAIKYDPALALDYINLANALAVVGQFADAERVIGEWTRRGFDQPHVVRASAVLAIAAIGQGRLHEASERLELMKRKTDDSNAGALFDCARIAAALSLDAQALEYAARFGCALTEQSLGERAPLDVLDSLPREAIEMLFRAPWFVDTVERARRSRGAAPRASEDLDALRQIIAEHKGVAIDPAESSSQSDEVLLRFAPELDATAAVDLYDRILSEWAERAPSSSIIPVFAR
jgi:predicted Zn-dependent protease